MKFPLGALFEEAQSTPRHTFLFFLFLLKMNESLKLTTQS